MNLQFLQFYFQEYYNETSVFSEQKFKFIIPIIAIFSPSLSSTISFVHFTHFSSYRRQKNSTCNKTMKKREKNPNTQFQEVEKCLPWHDRANIEWFFFFLSTKILFSTAILRTSWSTTIIASATNFWSVLSEDLWRDVSGLE